MPEGVADDVPEGVCGLVPTAVTLVPAKLPLTPIVRAGDGMLEAVREKPLEELSVTHCDLDGALGVGMILKVCEYLSGVAKLVAEEVPQYE